MVELIVCPECKSQSYIKTGKHLSRKGNRQRYICKKCARTFYGKESDYSL